jgi:hypothetical protein
MKLTEMAAILIVKAWWTDFERVVEAAAIFEVADDAFASLAAVAATVGLTAVVVVVKVIDFAVEFEVEFGHLKE